MKKILILSAVALLMGQAAFAQEEKKDDNYWFTGAGLGLNFGFDGQRYDDRGTSHNGAGIAADFYFGRWFSDWGGFRAGFQGLSISDKYTDFGNKRFEYVHGDMLIRAHRNIVPYIHAGWARIDNSGLAGGVGVAFPIHVSKRISIVPDIKTIACSNRVYETWRNFPALTMSATVGICINLGKKAEKEAPAITHPITIVVPETKTEFIRDTVVVNNNTTVVQEYKPNDLVTTISAGAMFDTGSDVIRPEAFPDLQAVADWMGQHPGMGILVEGHTDNVGGKEYNLDLSLRRAMSVKQYLVSQGVSPALISVEGFGFSRPIDTNDTAEGRQNNRRVEVRVR